MKKPAALVAAGREGRRGGEGGVTPIGWAMRREVKGGRCLPSTFTS